MVEFEPGDSKAILRLLHPFQTEMFAEMTEEWCLLFLQSKSESVQDVTRHRWGLWTYVTVTCLVHAGACAILLKWASQVAGSLGVWRSLEARFLGMEEAPSSNLGTSTILAIPARSVPSSSLILKYQNMKPLKLVQMVFRDAYCIDTK